MACRKLTYYENYSSLKVAYSKALEDKKSVQEFISTDPLAYKYANLSPYHFCADNPVLFIDKDGQDFFTYVKVQNETTGKTELQKVTFDGTNLTITDSKGNSQPLANVNPTSMDIASLQFIDDIVTSYNYIVTNGADIDNAMQTIASSNSIHIRVNNKKKAGDYLGGVINFDFNYGAEVGNSKGAFKGNQSAALGFWSEVYHAFVDLVDEKAKARYEDADAEEEYVHVKQERQVIDKLIEKNPAIQETKRNTYGDAGPGPKLKSATSTQQRPKEGKKSTEPYRNPIRHL
jgi:hypothetical protein